MKLICERTQAVVVESLMVANNPWTRIRGLLFKPELLSNQGLEIVPCNSIHSFGMRYALDVIYLDKKSQVVRTARDFRPNSLGPIVFKAHSVIELPPGSLDRIDVKTGDTLLRHALGT